MGVTPLKEDIYDEQKQNKKANKRTRFHGNDSCRTGGYLVGNKLCVQYQKQYPIVRRTYFRHRRNNRICIFAQAKAGMIIPRLE